MKAVAIVYLAIVAVLAINLAVGQEDEEKEPVIIDTGADLGKIQAGRAVVMEGLNKTGREYYWFTGIPYSDPKSYTGDNRFKISQFWEGGPLGPAFEEGGAEVFVANASKAIRMCPQNPVIDLVPSELASADPLHLIKSYYGRNRNKNRMETSYVWGREACLVITISTPKLPEGGQNPKLPVIFFIHGGGFDAFWGNVFGGQRLLKHDVVLVTINYRLGVLGSLNLGIEEAPGNQAVYDCISALKWVNKYIHHFGGDKDRVTVSGQSAGAVLATTVFLSPLAKGLIHGAVGDSGSALSVWANQKNPIRETLKVVRTDDACKRLVPNDGLPDDKLAKEIRDCMQQRSLVSLVNDRDRYGALEYKEARLGYDGFVPQVQKAELADVIDLALDATPAEIMKKGLQNNVPLMMGATRHDGSFVVLTTFYDYLVAQGLDSDAEFIKNGVLPKFLQGVGLEDPSGAMTHAFAKIYMGDAANSDDITSKTPGLLDIHSVLGFKAGAYGLVEEHSKLNPKSYYYAFDYKGMFTTFDIANGETAIPGGIAHVDDLLYLFQLIPLLTEKDWAVSERYVKYWVNFATYGNPNGPEDLDKPFPRYNEKDHRFLVINETDRVGYHCRDTWVGNSLELM